MPRVSVVLPVYNVEKYLAESIRSLLEQTYRDFEIVAVDDGSSDSSWEILNSFADPRLRILKRRENLGVVAARNRAIEESDSEFIGFLDADDIAHSTRLNTQIKVLTKRPEVGIVASDALFLREGKKSLPIGGTVPENEIPAVLLFRNCIVQSTVLMRRSAWEPYRSEFIVAQDYDLWSRLSRKHQFVILPDRLVSYREHPKQNSQVKAEAMLGFIRTIQRRMLEPFGIYSPIHHQLAKWPPDSTLDQLKEAEAWLVELLRANKVYLRTSFLSVLKKIWYIVCMDSWRLSSAVHKVYYASPLASADPRGSFQLLRRYGPQMLRKRLNSGAQS